MAIDRAHSSPQTTLDTIEASETHLSTHTGAVWNISASPRRVLRACAGGGSSESKPLLTHDVDEASGAHLETYMDTPSTSDPSDRPRRLRPDTLRNHVGEPPRTRPSPSRLLKGAPPTKR
jgi:hypothetical protein